MDRRHLGTEDGVILSHLLREGYFFDSAGVYRALFAFLFPHLNRGEQGAYADSRRAQIVHFVDFQAGIDFVGAGKDVVHLVRGHGVKTAAAKRPWRPLSDMGKL